MLETASLPLIYRFNNMFYENEKMYFYLLGDKKKLTYILLVFIITTVLLNTPLAFPQHKSIDKKFQK
jgi:hypothetical protein